MPWWCRGSNQRWGFSEHFEVQKTCQKQVNARFNDWTWVDLRMLKPPKNEGVGIDHFPTIVVIAWGFIPGLGGCVSIPQLSSYQKQKVALTVFDGWWLLKTKNSPTLFMVRAPNRWNVMPCDFKSSNRGAWVWGHSRFIPKLLVARLGFGGRCKEHFPKRQRNAITEKNPHETQIDRFWLITQIPRGASENFLKSRYEILPSTVLRLHVNP